jgi:S1-C subfamily serine protease
MMEHLYRGLRYCLALLPIMVCTGMAVAAEDVPERAVVKIFVTKQQYDFTQPWQRSAPEKSSGSGAIIDSNRILTCAHVVEFGEFIEVRKAKDSRKYIATVQYIAPEYDLAILRVDDARFFNKVSPLQLADLPQIGQRVTAYGFPSGGDDLSITSGIVSRIEATDYSYSDYNNLAVQIDAAINPGNSGGPVLLDGKLAGVAFQGRTQAQGIGYMVPTPVVRCFLRDVDDDGRYDGPVPLYVKWQKLENPALRTCYGVADTVSGVLVNEVHPRSALYGSLLPNDVLLRVDGGVVENDGSVGIPPQLRSGFETALQLHGRTDTVSLEVKRGDALLDLHIPLHFRHNAVRLVDKIELEPKYCIENGFVFTTPSYYYFRNDGYWAYKNPELSYYYYGQVLNADTARQIVLLSSVLPDESNVGYHDVHNKIVRKFNGKTVQSLAWLVDAFRKNRDSDIILEDEDGSKYVIRATSLQEVNTAIMKRYGIRDRVRL